MGPEPVCLDAPRFERDPASTNLWPVPPKFYQEGHDESRLEKVFSLRHRFIMIPCEVDRVQVRAVQGEMGWLDHQVRVLK